MKDRPYKPACPECVFIGWYAEAPMFLCSRCASRNSTTGGILNGGSTASSEQATWVRSKVPHYFNPDGTLSDVYFAMQKLLQ